MKSKAVKGLANPALKMVDMPIGPALGSLRDIKVSQAERRADEIRTSKIGTITRRRCASN